MAKTIEDFKVGDRIRQRMRMGLTKDARRPSSGTITKIELRSECGGRRIVLDYYIDGEFVGWIWESDWLYQ